MSEQDSTSVPSFRPDFAARVVRKARTTRARRRVAAVAIVGIAAFSVAWFTQPLWQVSESPAPRTVAYRTLDTASAAMQARQLDLLFPGADSLARFDRNYSAAMSGMRVEDQNAAQDSDASYDTD